MRPDPDYAAQARALLEPLADPEVAAPMAAYMKHKFPFFGIKAPARRQALKELQGAFRPISAAQLEGAVLGCFEHPERELHQAGVDLCVRWQKALVAESLPTVRRLVQTHSWWDTVDALAANVVGPLVQRNPELGEVMDIWIDDPDMWVARTAILHQLKYREATEAQRLFAYVDKRSLDTEFFIRKALGWALRSYGATAPEDVIAFVHAHPELSGLTRREALKHLA